MTTYQLWLIFGVPFLFTGLLYIGVAKAGGKRPLLILLAALYVVFVCLGPIWLCMRYFGSGEIWYGIAVSLGFRFLELTVFKVGIGFVEAWKKGG
jgi:hypothetical protein